MITGNLKDGYVKTEHHRGMTTIEFFHPQSNSLPAKILDELAQSIHRAGNDEETKVIVLRSAGDKSFCAGASFDELTGIKNEEREPDQSRCEIQTDCRAGAGNYS